MTNERPDWDDQFAESDDERQERWRRIRAHRKANLGRHDAAGEWHSGPTGPGEDVRDVCDAYRDALEAVLLFHSASPWTPEKQARWAKLTGEQEATTRALCDAVRRALG